MAVCVVWLSRCAATLSQNEVYYYYTVLREAQRLIRAI